MKKIKLLNIINLAIITIAIIVDIVLGFVMEMNKTFYAVTCTMIIGVSIVNLVFILIKEASVMTYDSKKLEPVAHVVTLLIASIGYYLVMHLNGYDNLAWLYWVLLVLLIVINSIVFYTLIRRDEQNKNKKSNGPRFLVNK